MRAIVNIIQRGVLISLIGILAFGSAKAQDMKQASELYNGAVSSYKSKPQKAIEDLTKVLSITKSIGDEESGKLARSANLLLPKAYLESAKQLYKQGQLDESVTAMERARDLADSVGDTKFAQQVNRTIPGIYFGAGNKHLKAGDAEVALSLYDRAIKANPKFFDPYIASAKILDSLDRDSAMLTILERGVAVAKESNNIPRMTDMQVMAVNHLKVKGMKMLQDKQHNDAIACFERAVSISPKDGESYFALAVSYQNVKNHAMSLEKAKLALENASGTMDKTQIYFLMGQEAQALGQTAEACANYKEAAFGTFKEAAEHQLKELGCK